MLVINNPKLKDRAEIIWEKGTNRQAFFRGQVDKYHWVDLGSSFLLSELNSAYLWGQLEKISETMAFRMSLRLTLVDSKQHSLLNSLAS